MKKKLLTVLTFLIFINLTSVVSAVDVKALLTRSDALMRGDTSYSEIEMKVVTPRWQRTVKMESWSKGTKKAFIKITYPKRDQGVTFLRIDNEMWQYIPKVERVVKIPPSMMLQSWMGSDFTNDDVVRADSIVVDYDHTITAEPTEDGTAYWVIEARPKPAAPVVWGRVELKIRKEDYIPVRVDYYDEDGTLVKYYETQDFASVEGRRLATRMTMHDQSRPGNSTALKYDSLTFKPGLQPDTFTVQNLRR